MENAPAIAQNPDLPTDIPDTKPKKVDIAKALTLRLQHGMTYQQIADIMGVRKQSVHGALMRFRELINSPDQVNAYEINRSKILSAAELQMIIDMTDSKKREKSNLQQLALAYDKLFQARRLTDGQSTENVNSMNIQLNFGGSSDK